MVMKYFLAIDIGASGGRHILGHLENGKIVTTEVYRFKNHTVKCKDGLVWEIDLLFEYVLAGLRKCKEIGKIPYAIGIDTWGVDYVLTDANGNRVGQAFSYRDLRTDGIPEKLDRIIPPEKLYKRTGIQRQPFNTIYQLLAHKEKNPEWLDGAEHMLMIPDYLEYRLTGVMAQEYTNATTTGLVNAKTKDWDYELIDELNLPRKIFGKIQAPGTFLGNFCDETREAAGFDAKVFMTASHDTASAIVAIPAESDEALYISSGTWSLMGIESMVPVCCMNAKKCNLTNEGGYGYRFRFLKNIMGLWMIQRVREELCPDMDYESISLAAEECEIDSIVNVNDGRFLSPENMVNEIIEYLEFTGQEVPANIGQFARVIYRSLAKCYKSTLEEIEGIKKKHYPVLNIVGGGSMSDFLNQETANEINRPVLAGPTEGTAMGNLIVLLIADGEIATLAQGRIVVANSTDIKRYDPVITD